MKMRYVVIAVLAPLVLMTSAMSQTPPKREFRAVWLTTVGNGDWPSAPGLPVQTQKNELTTFLDKLKAVGINVVFLQVRPESDALYQSSIEPWSYWLTGQQGTGPSPSYDPLEFAVTEAHKRGMELHGWFNPYRAKRSNSTYTKAANHVINTHPDWLITIGGTTIVDPGKTVAREYVLRVICDVVRRYDIDGLVMDDYFYLEGITTEDAATFSAEPRGFTDVGDWRRNNVNLLVHGIYDSVMAIKPWVKFGMGPAGIWKYGVPPGTRGWDVYNAIYCDAVAWLQGKYIEYFAPQIYWRIGYPAASYSLLEPWWATQVNGRIYAPSLAAYKIGQSDFGGAGEIANQIRFYRNAANAQGNVPFTANNLTNNLGGIGDTLKNDIYRYPALVPVFPWKDTLAPNPPRAIQYASAGGSGTASIMWDVPLTAADGDSAWRYAVYRFDHAPSLPGELAASQNLLAVVGQRTYAPPSPPVSGTYYYVVTALDRNWSESEPSTILQVGPPPAPVLASPANGATSVPESTLVSWHRVPMASWYHIRVSTDPAFSTGILLNDSTVTDTVKWVKGYAGQVPVYWRVRARNGSGSSAYSETYSFVSGIPVVAALVSPANVTVDQPVVVPLRWSTAQAATSYRVQLALNASFSPTILDTSGITDTSVVTPSLDYYKIHFWRVKAVNTIGEAAWTPYFRFRTIQMTGVASTAEIPSEFALSQNYPNPFNPATVISCQLPAAGHVRIVVYDLVGREVGEVVNQWMEPGIHLFTFDASTLTSGVYFYRMTAGAFTATKRMMVIK